MKALKLKLDLEKEQTVMLDKMFWKWASVCNRISTKGETKQSMSPPQGATGIWFSKTQLNQAETDIKDLRKALELSRKRKEHQLWSVERRLNDIAACISNENERDLSVSKPKLFRPKKWVEKGLLKTRCHTESYWRRQIEELTKSCDRRRKSIEKIKGGKILLKPKRITLHQNSFLINFAKHEVLLKPLHGKNSNLAVRIIDKPVKPFSTNKETSSQKSSFDYMHNGILNYIAFAMDSAVLGMNRTEEMMMKAKRPEKVEKKKAILNRKLASFAGKRKTLEKAAGRQLIDTEVKAISSQIASFFSAISDSREPVRNEDYIESLRSIADDVMRRDAFVELKKYPILIRLPKARKKHKNMRNMLPCDWNYFIQISFEPLLDTIEPKNCPAVLGIDRGLSHIIALSILDPKKSCFVFNRLYKNDIKSWKIRKRSLVRSIQYMERRIRAQHKHHIHENQMKKSLRSLDDRIENNYHNISREVINLAMKHDAAIVMESLQGMKQHGRGKGKRMERLNYSLSLFDYQKIASLIKYKAGYHGIPVYEVAPPGTSQNCAKCLLEGILDIGNYERGREIIDGKAVTTGNHKVGLCKRHGQIDADLNAARVIAICLAKGLNNPKLVSKNGQNNAFKAEQQVLAA